VTVYPWNIVEILRI